MTNKIVNTFVKVSADCPAERGIVPASKKETKTAHEVQYEILTEHPYTYDLDGLIVETYIRHKLAGEAVDEARRAQVRGELLSKGQPCMRASMLPKKFGWGVHYDEAGRIAIVPMESEEYQRFLERTDLKQEFAMRNKKAGSAK
ncbi:hypothetical protein FE782_05740 [Paenibacillus antri]|uniref:Uncharacterized protein n=1 Tax=Paenibacillus antri TaxID=2582848 RepID=A0A5R9GET0_9BACL|nr:DUF6157 family protein [Paenibacillus antri]TLS52876.1 hypothetical protein FE782_05740 [Paenibacillus antri]